MTVYIDTSVIGGCLDPEFSYWSNKLMAEVKQGKLRVVISDETLRELQHAPEKVRVILDHLPSHHVINAAVTEETIFLANRYIGEGAINSRHLSDATHIALATIYRADVLASWNFKEMVNMLKIRKYNSVNLKYGYPLIDIRSPKELIYEE
jgi:predicted nucleic acid-binding protein